MSYDLQKWQEDEKALARERQRMTDALARLGQIETRGAARRSGRLVFALDLTSSREPALRQARIATARMLETIKALGSLAVKLVYFRGRSESRSSHWEHDPGALKRALEKLSCKAGYTQIAKVLRLVLAEKEKPGAVIYIGDACEEDSGELAELAAALGEKNIPLFVFHDLDGRDVEATLAAKPVFERLAEISGGVYCEFRADDSGVDNGAALRELLSTVAAFSAGGIEGVKQVPHVTTPQARQLQSRLLLLGPGGAEGKQ